MHTARNKSHVSQNQVYREKLSLYAKPSFEL